MNIQKSPYAEKIMNHLSMRVVGSGLAEVSTDWYAKDMCSLFSRIYYILDGEGYIRSETQEIKLQPGRCYFIPAGMTFDHWCETSLIQLFFHVIVEEAGFSNFFEGIDRFAQLPVSPEQMAKVIACYQANAFLPALEIRALLEEVLLQFIQQYQISAFPSDGYSPEIKCALRYIHQNLSVQLKAETIAANQFISKSKLIKLFKSEMGTTIGRYIDQQLFAKAEFLLLKTKFPIKKISEDLGFCDQFYFSRRFTQMAGETPRAYRNRAQAENHI